MKHPKNSHFFVLCLSLIFTALLGVVAPKLGFGLSQNTKEPGREKKEDRTIRKYAWRNEPLEISTLKIKGKLAKLGVKIIEEDDWLNGLTVTVKNISTKTIVWIELNIEFPTPLNPLQEPASLDHLVYGLYPQPPGQEVTPHPDQPPLEPGAKADVILTDYEGLREFLIQTNKPGSIKEVEISISEVVFNDGTKWSGGQLFRRDLNDPNRWYPERPQVSLKRRKKSVFNEVSFNHASRPQDPGIFPIRVIRCFMRKIFSAERTLDAQ